MEDTFGEVILSAGAIVAIAFVFFWVLPDKLLPFLSKISESETLLITPFQSYIVGVLLIIGVFCLFLSKR